MATSAPDALPDKVTWYLVTNLPRPPEEGSPHPAADREEIVRIYGIRHWIEQSYKQVKDELGWTDFQVRSDIAIRRHQVLVNCAFSFCWDTWSGNLPTATSPPPPAADTADGEKNPRSSNRPGIAPRLSIPAAGTAGLARPVDHAAALVGRLVQRAPASTGPGSA